MTMRGASPIWLAPSTAMEANQTSMIGPKKVATPPVPWLCTMKRVKRITSVIGTT